MTAENNDYHSIFVKYDWRKSWKVLFCCYFESKYGWRIGAKAYQPTDLSQSCLIMTDNQSCRTRMKNIHEWLGAALLTVSNPSDSSFGIFILRLVRVLAREHPLRRSGKERSALQNTEIDNLPLMQYGIYCRLHINLQPPHPGNWNSKHHPP